ncbi:GNAT family N-acetyltransferase [Amycolatopsis endophytica]|uniref:Ribosomal protein S18 acetylase RimI-like enzyme n=1 Tax=Amycolatopsis endophytica TaxID=860233 RepID=A0A853BB98_9PSEU|nr:GNAT family N-acetyltransferase [Amycolatopsis endophytica]NYI92449.1 ribosomal protein S18 acetylase RimI-like enzyme [Amycolatopsis endophytica]
MTGVLDNPAYAALTGPHSRFARSHGQAVRYDPDVSPWAALPGDADETTWKDMAGLAGPGGLVSLPGPVLPPPPDWPVEFTVTGVQMVAESVETAPDAEAVRLTEADVPDMLALAARTRPGPFLPRTVELGTYLGFRRDGQLIAMAGERMRPPGWTEISAVCTDAQFRGQGLGTRLVLAVAHGIAERGETPFLHAAAANTSAVRLYAALGFRTRRPIDFVGVRVPEDVGPGTTFPPAA